MIQRLIFVVTIVALLIPTLALGQPRSSGDPDLQKAIDQRRAARVAKDIATWSRLTSDDAMEIHSDGRVHTKSEEIAEIKTAKPLADIPDTDKTIRMYGATGIFTYQRNPAEGARRATTVWVKNASGQWQCVLTQQSAVIKPK